MNNIIKFEHEKISGKYNIPAKKSDKLCDRTITTIINAWNNAAIINKHDGRVWVSSEKIHNILRTTPENARYMIASLGDDQKHWENVNLFIRGESICYLLDIQIQTAGDIFREGYLKHSHLVYIAIRDCDLAEKLRYEYYEYLGKKIASLKQKRIRKNNVQYDELTGEPLNSTTAEFSHIRSASLFPHLAGFVENGLIVNKNTHDLITSMRVNDENQLIELCNKYNWKTDWYSSYKGYIGNDIS
jgi:hypothetical protein